MKERQSIENLYGMLTLDIKDFVSKLTSEKFMISEEAQEKLETILKDYEIMSNDLND